MGNARGGEPTWNTMYKHLLTPLNADLALLFGKVEEKTSSLYKNAKYVWEIEEYKNWRTFYEDYNLTNILQWVPYIRSEGLGGGVDDNRGSGLIIFAFRHFLKTHYKEILKQYDRIILSRSDFYYIDDHPELDINKFYVIEGEDYYGISDRHHIFNKDMIDDSLSILEFLNNNDNKHKVMSYHGLFNVINPEMVIKVHFEDNGILKQLDYFRRVQFTVRHSQDQTRWSTGSAISEFPGFYLKYPEEYYLAIKRYKEKFNKDYIP